MCFQLFFSWLLIIDQAETQRAKKNVSTRKKCSRLRLSQKPTSPFICKAAIAVLSLFFLMRLKKKDNCWRYVVLLYRQT